jgi:PAS domain S-box-containing protein
VTDDHSLKPATLADQLMAANIFAELMAATYPSELGQRLTEQLRELTGARTVMLIAHPEGQGEHAPIHTCPSRRQGLWNAVELGEFCPNCSPDPLPYQPAELAPGHPLRTLLDRAGVESFLRFPLRVGGEMVASLLLLDLPGLERIDEIVATVAYLSPVMALALRNSLALARIERQARELEAQAQDLDRRVAERTTDLEAANKSLAASRLAALNVMNDAVLHQQRAEEVAAALQREVAERKRVEDSLRQFKTIFDAANFGAAITDLGGVITYANDRFAADHGYTPQELLGQSVRMLHNDEQQASTARLLLQLKTQGRFDAEEVWHCRRNGSVYPMLMTGMAVRDSQGAPLCYVATAIDLSERKALEEQLQQAQKMESVGRLAGGVAHDFNNMLGVILGHTELSLEQVDPAQTLYANLVEIRKAAIHSADLTRQLLAFARKQTVALQVLNLNEVVAGMLKMLKRLIGEDIELEWKPTAELWPIRMDPSQIDQILVNLCVNARDAIAGVGRLAIECGNRTLEDGHCDEHAGFVSGDYVMLSVNDSGSGMDKETQSHLFEPFFTTKESGKGTGLGLATVYGAVKQNGGFIDVYSEMGMGTTFKVYLPRLIGTAAQATTTVMTQAMPHGHETILLVEDELAILRLTATVLRRRGYTVLSAGTPGEAIRLAREHKGDLHLLMTDVVMPEMNGRDLARSVQILHPKIKRLFVSGYTADVIAHHGVLEAGVHFLQKPATMANLTAKVREVLDHP